MPEEGNREALLKPNYLKKIGKSAAATSWCVLLY